MRRYSEPPALAGRLDLVAFFAALGLLFSTLEYLIPKPIPFLRLGLANLPLLVGLDLFPVPLLLLLILLKVLGQGLIHGTLFSYVFLFSATGSLASGLIMIAARRLGGRRITLVGVSLLGALGSNLAQLLLSRFLVFGEGAYLIAPPFLIAGTASGFLLGLFAQRFSDSSSWLAAIRIELREPPR